MSRGAGVVQRRLIAAFEVEPGRRFKVKELAEIVFPGEPVERKHEVSVRRALNNLPGTVKANKYRPFSASNPVERVGDS